MSTPKSATDSIDVRLRDLQTANGWTIPHMAELAGLSKNSLQNYMRKTSPQKPGVDALKSMSVGFKVSVDWLLGLSSENSDGSQISISQADAFQRTGKIQFIRYINHEHEFYGEKCLLKERCMVWSPKR